MAITFPASPTNGQTFTSGSKTWQWDGTTWLSYAANISPSVFKVDATNARVGINNQSPSVELDMVGTQVIRAASTQDGIQLAGRAGGTTSLTTKLIPTTLTTNRTLTLPDATGTVITTGNLTSITNVGTLSSLTVDGANSPAITIGDYSGLTTTSAIESNSGHLVLGASSPSAIYLRTTNAQPVYIGANLTNLLSVGTTTMSMVNMASPTITFGQWSGSSTYSAIETTKGHLILGKTTGDDNIYLRSTTASTNVYIGGNQNNTLTVGTSTATVAGTLSATAYTSTSANQTTNYIKLGTAAADSEGSLFGYTAYGAIRTTCGYGVGISLISNGGSGPTGFTPNAHAVFLAAGTVSGDIRSNSSTTVSYNTSSDYRLKENISEITDGIERIRQLRPVKYQFKDPNNDTFYDGFLAHEVQPVAPYAISGEKDAVGENGLPMYQQIDTSWLVGLLAAGIKDLDKRLTELEGLTNGS